MLEDRRGLMRGRRERGTRVGLSIGGSRIAVGLKNSLRVHQDCLVQGNNEPEGN